MPAPFPLPPLEEQQRIVATVGRLMAECDTLEAQQEAAAQVRVRCTEAATHALQTADTPAAVRTAWHRLRDHFATLTATPDAVDAVRQTILQLAVQGKLTEQDPNDEPAEVLLERIQAEKQRLYEAGEIRKPKELQLINDDEKSFELPQGWTWAKLGRVAEMSTGIAFRSKDYVEEGVFVLRVTNIEKDGRITRDNAKYFPEEKVDSKVKKRRLEAGDILVVMVGGSLGKVGYVTEDDMPALLNQNMWRIRPFSDLLLRPYLKIVIEYINTLLIDVTSSTHGHLTMSGYRDLVIPLSPPEEQHRIVATVNRLMEQCDVLEAQLEREQTLGEQLLEAVLHGAAQGEKQPALQEAMTVG